MQYLHKIQSHSVNWLITIFRELTSINMWFCIYEICMDLHVNSFIISTNSSLPPPPLGLLCFKNNNFTNYYELEICTDRCVCDGGEQFCGPVHTSIPCFIRYIWAINQSKKQWNIMRTSRNLSTNSLHTFAPEVWK